MFAGIGPLPWVGVTDVTLSLPILGRTSRSESFRLVQNRVVVPPATPSLKLLATGSLWYSCRRVTPSILHLVKFVLRAVVTWWVALRLSVLNTIWGSLRTAPVCYLWGIWLVRVTGRTRHLILLSVCLGIRL